MQVYTNVPCVVKSLCRQWKILSAARIRWQKESWNARNAAKKVFVKKDWVKIRFRLPLPHNLKLTAMYCGEFCFCTIHIENHSVLFPIIPHYSVFCYYLGLNNKNRTVNYRSIMIFLLFTQYRVSLIHFFAVHSLKLFVFLRFFDFLKQCDMIYI